MSGGSGEWKDAPSNPRESLVPVRVCALEGLCIWQRETLEVSAGAGGHVGTGVEG